MPLLATSTVFESWGLENRNVENVQRADLYAVSPGVPAAASASLLAQHWDPHTSIS